MERGTESSRLHGFFLAVAPRSSGELGPGDDAVVGCLWTC